ncbi:PIN domain-like protein, partial [Schizophyllum commune]
DLSAAFHQLARYLNSPCTVVFVFDGPQKTNSKRGTTVIDRDTTVLKAYKELIHAMRFHILDAAGEADADLGVMSRYGLINGVLSDDSDLFLFGGKTVIRSPSIKNDGDTVKFYRATDIRRHSAIGLNQTQLVLFALLVGNDYDPRGLKGCGSCYALALARSHLSTELSRIAETDEPRPSHMVLQWRAHLLDELNHNTSRLLPHALPRVAADMPQSFPDLDVLRLLARPITTPLWKLQAASYGWHARMPDMGRLTELCSDYFSWDRAAIAARFEKHILPGICLRYLLQVRLLFLCSFAYLTQKIRMSTSVIVSRTPTLNPTITSYARRTGASLVPLCATSPCMTLTTHARSVWTWPPSMIGCLDPQPVPEVVR